LNSFWLFRTNLRLLEYYHSYNTLSEFESNCHDFYLLQGLWILRNTECKKFVVWRLSPSDKTKNIIFDIEGKTFEQRFVNNFQDVFKYDKPDISFFRGGFREYDDITKKNPKFFGKKLYLGAGWRITQQWNGIYDNILIEDEKELNLSLSVPILPFYKTANSKIFFPKEHTKKIYDLAWICNNKQIRQKGQEFFISEISKSNYLKKLKIVHIGNKPEIGKKICTKYNVNNINFVGQLDRVSINNLLNQSRFGIVTSNKKDGCPRVITEILMSGTPLLIRESTRLLDYYKQPGTIVFSDNMLNNICKDLFVKYNFLQKNVLNNITNIYSFDHICKKNWNLWTRK